MLDGISINAIADVIASLFLLGLTGAIAFLIRRVGDLGQLSRDWKGQPARPGFPEIPGVPQRLERVEVMLGQINHEVHFNSGTSIKDAVHRTDASVVALHDQLLVLQESVDTKSSQVSVDTKSSQVSVDTKSSQISVNRL